MNSAAVLVTHFNMGNKRRQFSLSFKLQAIDKWRLLDKNYTKTASFFKIDRKTLRAWINNEEQLRSHDGEKRYAKRVFKFPLIYYNN